MFVSSVSTFALYAAINLHLSLSFECFVSSLVSMELTMRHDARRAPMTFLNATLSKFLSSTLSSSSLDFSVTSLM